MNELSHELREENNRLLDDLCFERNLNTILEKFRNYSLVLINDCKCDRNSAIIRKINELNVDYKCFKSKQLNVSNKSKNESKSVEDIEDSIQRIKLNIQHKSNKDKELIDINESFNEESYDCVKCGQTVANEKEMIIHLNKFHNRCGKCKNCFLTGEDKRLHQCLGHRSDEYKAFKCRECHQLFDTNESLVLHRNLFHKQLITTDVTLNDSIDSKSELIPEINESNNGSNYDNLGAKRRKGRPKRSYIQMKRSLLNELNNLKIVGKFEPKKRWRRPKRNYFIGRNTVNIVSNSMANKNSIPKRGRGRPRKETVVQSLVNNSDSGMDGINHESYSDVFKTFLTDVTLNCDELPNVSHNDSIDSKSELIPENNRPNNGSNSDNLNSKRGRPKKTDSELRKKLRSLKNLDNKPKRGRGRPKKKVFIKDGRRGRPRKYRIGLNSTTNEGLNYHSIGSQFIYRMAVNNSELGLTESNPIAEESKPELNLITEMDLNYRQNLLKIGEQNTEQDLNNVNLKTEPIEEIVEQNYELNSVYVKQELTEENFLETINSNSMEVNDTMNEELNEKGLTKSNDLTKKDKIYSNKPQVMPLCDECGDCFESELELEIHVNSNHKTIASFDPKVMHKCVECIKWFDSERSLVLHNYSIHKQFDYKCISCDFISQNAEHFRDHNKTHENQS